MDKMFMYLLDSFMIAAVVLAALALIVFFVTALKARRLKAAKRNHADKDDKPWTKPESRQATTEFESTEIQPDSFAQKHWGNLSIEERYAMLLPENKVLYAAAKKQLDASRLTNFKSEICEIYFDKHLPAARLLIYRGLIYLFLNIAPDTLDKAEYGHEDVSDKDGYEMLPTMIIIKESAQIDKIPRLLGMIETA